MPTWEIYQPDFKDNSTNDEDNGFENQEIQESDVETSVKDQVLETASLGEFQNIFDEWNELQQKINDNLNNLSYDKRNELESLLQNKDLVPLLNNLASEYDKWNSTDFPNNWDTQSLLDEWFTEEEIPESWEEYLALEASTNNFIDFITSDDGLNLIETEILNHTDFETWGQREDFPISEKALMHKIRRNFLFKIHDQYTSNLLIPDDQKSKEWNLNKAGMKIMSILDDVIENNLKNGENWNWLLDNVVERIKKSGLEKVLRENDDAKYDLWEYLEINIKEFAKSVVNTENANFLDTGDKQLNLELRTYLFVYNQYILSNDYTLKSGLKIENYESELDELLKALMDHDWLWKDAKARKEYEDKLKLIQERKKHQRERELAMRKKKAELNRRINSYTNKSPEKKEILTDDENKNYIDIQNASWAEIIKNSVDVDKIPSFKSKDSWEIPDDKMKHLKDSAFNLAWNDFLKQNSLMKSILTKDKMHELFDMNTMSINQDAWENFKKHELLINHKGDNWLSDHNKDNLDKIYIAIQSFSLIMEDKLESLSKNNYTNMEKIDNTVKVHALGAVIDNIKDIFSNMKTGKESEKSLWFLLDSKEPIEISDQNLLIYWALNWTKINLRYDLNTGELYINSFLKESNNPPMISICNEEPNLRIWNLTSFDTILDEYYNKPPLSLNTKLDEEHNYSSPLWPWRKWDKISKYEMIKTHEHKIDSEREKHIQENKEKFKELLGWNIDIINNSVSEYLKNSSYRNSMLSWFAKTFNLIPYNYTEWEIKFNKLDNGSNNAFNMFQILSNSTNNELRYLNSLMSKICKYSWIERWTNNITQNKTKWFPKLLFESDISDENTTLKYLKDNMGNIKLENDNLRNNIDSNLWIVAIIQENCTINSAPNRKLDVNKIGTFEKKLIEEASDLELMNTLKGL